ncbi:hypothetical protein [Algibacter mikhailovii]|uniref:Uncharacterized protein n=1 Tax=Algibacter mikhailovii TaxID=425498 RepID=A0A918RDW4_9FLAO|nr:hypothetical protein [Algibacter mikhailovii]GGZ94223.1 hypothetical protein GCM10007028_35660 [Algibacter mikhailovii]
MNEKTKAFLNSKGLIFGGFFMIAISLIIIWKGIEKKRITEENRIVVATVLETPTDCDNLGRRGGYYKLQFNDRIFVKSGNRIICESIVGKNEVDVLTNEEMDEIVLVNEYEEYNLWSGFALVFIGSIISFKGWRSQKRLPTICIING